MLSETRQGVLRIQQIVMDLKGFARVGDGAEESGRLEEALQEARRRCRSAWVDGARCA
ncbi:hypothetical protein ACN28S_17700 [Cystobacter fuscus]